MSFAKRIVPVLFCVFASSAFCQEFVLTSPDLVPGQALPLRHVLNGFGCAGGNQSPALHWRSPPEGTRSYALTLYDPDAPTGSGWWHWVVVDIPSATEQLAANAGNPAAGRLPAGAMPLRTDFGTPGYGGACPPAGAGAHRYVFTLHALDVPHLDLPSDAPAAMAGFLIHAHSLGRASLTVTYGR